MKQFFTRVVGRFYKSDVTSKPVVLRGRPAEVFYTDKPKVSCDGPDFSRHPRIYLTIPTEQSQVFCPYCSRVFKLQ